MRDIRVGENVASYLWEKYTRRILRKAVLEDLAPMEVKDFMEQEPKSDNIPAWRKLEPADRADFMMWVKSSLIYQEEIGEDKYHSREKGFQGDPLEHLEQEIFDAIFYLWEEKRRQGLEGNAPESRIYRAVQLLLEGTYYDHEERVTIDGMLFRMNAIREVKPKDTHGPIALNIRLTQVPHEEPESVPVVEPGEAVADSEDCLGMIFLEQGTALYKALKGNLGEDGHTRDCETLRKLRSGDCSATCVDTIRAIQTWEKRPAPAPSPSRRETLMEQGADLYLALLANHRPDGHTKDCGTGMNGAPPRSSSCSDICKLTANAIETWEERQATAIAKAGLEYLRAVDKERESQGCSSPCNCHSPTVDHGDALVQLSRDEADRLDKS